MTHRTPQNQDPSQEIQALLEKMSAEELEAFGKWYVDHLKKQSEKEARDAHDQAKKNPTASDKAAATEKEIILRRRLGLS